MLKAFIKPFTCIVLATILMYLSSTIVKSATTITSKRDYCLKKGICYAGQVIYYKGQELEIERYACKIYGWKWNEKGRFCKIDMDKYSFDVQ